MPQTIVVSVNASWNLLNFRTEILRRLTGMGFRIVALTPRDEHHAALADLGVEHVPIAIDSQGLSPLADMRLLRAYWHELRRIRPDAFLGWTVKPNVYGSLAAHALGIPVINNVSGLGTAFIRQGPLTRLVSMLYRLAIRKSATVFFQNRDDRDLFVGRGLVKPSAAVLLPGSGIDTLRFAPTAPRPGGSFVFLLVARLIRDKGVLEYVEAARMLMSRHPDVRFDLLGALDVANRTAIARVDVERWVAEGVIRYRGQAEDVRPFIAEADCVVLPSYREGLPRSLLEAAAMGKPLVATDVVGCRDIARRGVNALLCAPGDPASLAGAMEAMLALSSAERARMAAAGRDLVVNAFDQGIVVQRYVDALGTVLNPTVRAG